MSIDKAGSRPLSAENSLNRRQLLKRLGFGSLAIVGSGTLVTTLQGCSSAIDRSNHSATLNAGETETLGRICEGILPRTQTPGAIDAQVAEHLSQALSISYRQREADYFQKGMAIFIDRFERDSGGSLIDADTPQVSEHINSYLRRYAADPAVLEKFEREFEENSSVNDDFLETYFVTNVIDATIWSYFTSELVGENIMRYDPVPGSYDACIEYNAGEHSWSS